MAVISSPCACFESLNPESRVCRSDDSAAAPLERPGGGASSDRALVFVIIVNVVVVADAGVSAADCHLHYQGKGAAHQYGIPTSNSRQA